MVILQALWRDGKQPQAHAATLYRHDDELVLQRQAHAEHWRLDEIRLEAGIDSLPDLLHLPDGSTLEVADRRIRALLGGLSLADRSAHWLQQSWRAMLLLSVASVAVLWLGYRYLLPASAAVMAQLVPVGVEQAMADSTLRWMEGSGLLAPSQHDDARRQQLQARLQALIPPDSPYRYRLLLRDAPVIGANAFALPGGSIIVTDQLLQRIDDDNELLAVLAHEAGHVEARHGLRDLLQSSGLLLAVTLITGDSSTALATLPLALANASYSREHEREADRYAYARLRAHGLSPCLLGYSLQRISSAANSGPAWLSSHPDTGERSRPDGQSCPPAP